MKHSVKSTHVVENKIFVIRGHKVMLSPHLAELYGTSPRVLIQAVKRNLKRFPEDFMFQLTLDEAESLRSQFVILKDGEKRQGQNIKYLPYAFTEHGVAMLSAVLNSERAIQVSIAIIRTFVKLREILSTHKEVLDKICMLELKVGKHDKEIRAIFEAIRQLMAPPEKKKGKIGFYKEEDEQDLKSFKNRIKEPTVSYEKMLRDLKAAGKI